MNRKGALSWINYLDAAVLAASSEAAGMPIGNLQSDHLSTRWRSDGVSGVSLTADYTEALPVDVIGVFGANFTSGAQWRIRLSSSGAHAGDLYDSGLIAMNPDIRIDRRNPAAPISKSQALHLLMAPVTAQYRKIDLLDGALTYFEIGIGWDGKVWQPERNFGYGQSPQIQDPSTTTTAVAGNDYTDLRPQKMTDTFTWPALTEDERKIVSELDATVGTARNLLWIRDPLNDANATALLGRQTQIAQMPIIAHNRRSRQFQISERL